MKEPTILRMLVDSIGWPLLVIGAVTTAIAVVVALT